MFLKGAGAQLNTFLSARAKEKQPDPAVKVEEKLLPVARARVLTETDYPKKNRVDARASMFARDSCARSSVVNKNRFSTDISWS